MTTSLKPKDDINFFGLLVIKGNLDHDGTFSVPFHEFFEFLSHFVVDKDRGDLYFVALSYQ